MEPFADAKISIILFVCIFFPSFFIAFFRKNGYRSYFQVHRTQNFLFEEFGTEYQQTYIDTEIPVTGGVIVVVGIETD